ncbi:MULTISPECIES: hypothetical protein [Pontibacter]|uniref:SpoIIAA-like n=1 Tax=Pontibacter lucknowensis TaxID=1077936 RepID=A0A1N6WH87_9BACT|nr:MULTISPECIES: hypothetical protein [Pontibacter]EJF11531.1 hypothetical protein O71_02312 [Pontibacter sp. BAB1700]SIQ89421.1 hypothetical protein SAMN05421545_1538 [Pontibacter lucknowensis]
MELFKSDTCTVDYVEDRLMVQYNRTMQAEEFREGLLEAFRFAMKHHVKQWLFDLRNIGKLSEEEETWLQVQLFPQIMMHLGTGNHVALVVDENCYHDMIKESGLLGLKSYNSFIIINTFCDIQDAINWLDHRQSECA